MAAAVTAALSAPGGGEEVRAAASHALGGVTRGALGHFLPGLVAQIQGAAGQPKMQYLLLQVGVGGTRGGDTVTFGYLAVAGARQG